MSLLGGGSVRNNQGKPLICITAGAAFFEGHEREFANSAYFRMVTENGGIPLLVSPRMLWDEDLVKTIDTADGLLVAGGPDVDPHLYGEEPVRGIRAFDPVRDAAEVALVRNAADACKPILGICRGMQVINVAFGGSLFQDIGEDPRFFVDHYQRSARSAVTHSVEFAAGHIAKLCGATKVRVNSFHHQAINVVGEGLHITGRAADGVPESIEHVDRCSPGLLQRANYVMAVQWHIEEIWRHPHMRPIVVEFLQACLS